MLREEALNKILEELRLARGTDFSTYRISPIGERIAVRMAQLNIRDPLKYLAWIQSHPSEYDCLIEALTIKVSSFFREPVVFEIIAQQVLPRTIERLTRLGNSQLRVWIPGTATGEEAYSVAILIHEAMAHEDVPWRPYIFATDISEQALNTAKAGVYGRQRLESVKLGFLDKYFILREGSFEVRPFIRKMIRFSRDDLTSADRISPADSVFGTFDLVLCRNVLIYFSPELQKRIFRKLYTSLGNGGFLILGDCESLVSDISWKLIPTDPVNRIFQKPESFI